jgi:F-type H+-transporting ATPase subunit epsilon
MTMQRQIKLTIMTPQGVVFDGDVNSFTAPGYEGLFGVFPEHAPYLCSLKEGDVMARAGTGVTAWSIDGGVADVNGTSARLLVGWARPSPVMAMH